MKSVALFLFNALFSFYVCSQSVGIGTPTPHDKAVLDISSNNKGVLFPRMTTVQRNTITNPPDGLHIFNTDERTLNYYDSVYGIWNCYLEDCKTEIILISSNTCNLDFFTAYAKDKPANRYLVIIQPGITIRGCTTGDTALSFIKMPLNVTVTIRNYGAIDGAGGRGGGGRIQNNYFPTCNAFSNPGTNGSRGGHAIATKTGVPISVTNYGIVAGGGGGGGAGGDFFGTGYGGGGGGGAGNGSGNGGAAGAILSSSGFPGFSCVTTVQSSPGLPGTVTLGGVGGAGSPAAGTGGTGGLRGQPGSAGSDNIFMGGPAGKAIAGGAGNILTNVGGGLSYGTVD